MSMTDLPQMLVSESAGWRDIDRAHHSRAWYFRWLVAPLALLPPACYAYAQLMHPGVVFALSVPAQTASELAVAGVVFYLAELAMVSYLAMLVRRVAMARDHDPGDDGPYALAAIGSTPLWIGSLAMLVPSQGFNLFALLLATAGALVLIRHGVRPLLHVDDPRKAHVIADLATMAGVAVWFGFMLVSGLLLSILLVHWQIG